MGTFDSGLTQARAASIRRTRLCLLFTVMAISCGLGIVVRERDSLLLLGADSPRKCGFSQIQSYIYVTVHSIASSVTLAAQVSRST